MKETKQKIMSTKFTPNNPLSVPTLAPVNGELSRKDQRRLAYIQNILIRRHKALFKEKSKLDPMPVNGRKIFYTAKKDTKTGEYKPVFDNETFMKIKWHDPNYKSFGENASKTKFSSIKNFISSLNKIKNSK